MTITHSTKEAEGAHSLRGSDVTLLQQSPAAAMLFLLTSLRAQVASCFMALGGFKF